MFEGGIFMINIAIDGFTGSGKSTLTRMVAKRLGDDFRVLDTGAIFRGFGYAYDQSEFSKSGEMTEEKVSNFLKNVTLEVKFLGDGQHVFVNGKDVTGHLREEKIGQLASKISTFKPVRARYLETAQNFAKNNNCVMEGRDIATVVMPFAQVKIFLTADEKVRAKRRFDELCTKGVETTFDEVLKDLKERDKRDTERKEAPLKVTNESIVVDNSNITLEETADYCCEIIKKIIGDGEKTNIAIDGYVCSGKSTIARALAKRLGFKVFDTGAIYRGIACAFNYMKLDESKISQDYIEKFAKQINVSIDFQENVQHVFVNGIDYTAFLRNEDISLLTPKISPFTCIREKVLFLQRDFAKKNNLVMEGRDIGSYVLPNANFKFFCTADEKVRAQRRYEQQKAMGEDVSFDEILKDLRERDYKDTHRDHGAIVQTKDSIVVDTTNQNLEQSVEFCVEQMRLRGFKG